MADTKAQRKSHDSRGVSRQGSKDSLGGGDMFRKQETSKGTISSRMWNKFKTLGRSSKPGEDMEDAAANDDTQFMGELAENPVALHTMPQVTRSEVTQIPIIRGVNLGGWLVLEEWMSPTLFSALPKSTEEWIQDGARFRLMSHHEKWVCAEDGGGSELVADREIPDKWETFTAILIGDGMIQIRAWNGNYVSTEGGFNHQLVADKENPGTTETFLLHRVGTDKVQLQAATGAFIRATKSGQIAAVCLQDPGEEETFTIDIPKGGSIRGEYQLCRYLGQTAATALISQHRQSFIRKDDFEYMAAKGINTVRIPVGFWIMDTSPEPPYVGGSALFLDAAFDVAMMFGIRVIISIHAARGSQNGYDHSAPRDRFIDWPNRKLGHVAHTLSVVEWLVVRYHKRPNFFGIELLNEPTSWGVPLPVLQMYYSDGYRIVRKYSEKVYVIMCSRVGGQIGEWATFMTDKATYFNIILDVHMYQVHDRIRFGTMSAEDHIRFAKHKRLDEIRRLGDHPSLLVLVGEWSASLPKAANASEPEYIQFAKEQFATFGEATAGWCYWSYKIERQGYRHWSLRKSIEAGYLPSHLAPDASLPVEQEPADTTPARVKMPKLPSKAGSSQRQSLQEDGEDGDEIRF